MKTLATQFDNNRLSNAVATPTCSSCCCCCCCLASAITSSIVTGQRISKGSKINKLKHKSAFTLLAYVSLLIPLSLSVLVIDILKTVLPSNKLWFVDNSDWLLYIFMAPFSVLILWFLFMYVKMKLPLLKATIFSAITLVALFYEYKIGYQVVENGNIAMYLLFVPVTILVIPYFSHLYLKYNLVADDSTISGDANIAPAYQFDTQEILVSGQAEASEKIDGSNNTSQQN